MNKSINTGISLTPKLTNVSFKLPVQDVFPVLYSDLLYNNRSDFVDIPYLQMRALSKSKASDLSESDKNFIDTIGSRPDEVYLQDFNSSILEIG